MEAVEVSDLDLIKQEEQGRETGARGFSILALAQAFAGARRFQPSADRPVLNSR